MSSARKECFECGRNALVETIKRNDGICELCAKGKQAIKDGESISPSSEKIVLWIMFVASGITSAYVVKRCLDADWEWFWSLFSIVWSAPIAFNLTSFLIGCVLWCHRKISTGRPTRGEKASDGKPDTAAS